jgi:cytochrome c
MKIVKFALHTMIAVGIGATLTTSVLAAGNPCAPKKTHTATNPCAAGKMEIDPKTISRPADYKPMTGNHAELAKEGEKLWKDSKLSTNGMSCNTCHQSHGAFQDSFAKPYPHQVAMTKDKAGMKTVHLDEMIQACMAMPMAAKPLPWNSRELAALVAYTQDVQKTFKPGSMKAGNPCSAKPANPCAVKPANPCAKK